MTSTPDVDQQEPTGLHRTISGRLLYFYVLGDVLGSGIYVLLGAVAGAVGGAFWLAFAVGVSIATITGLAYAELVTRFPKAAGAALYVEKAFQLRPLTFLVTFAMLAASFAAAGSLATGFATYFGEVWDVAPALLVALLFLGVLAVVNFAGIVESVVANFVLTLVEVVGLVVVVVVGVVTAVEGDADLSRLLSFSGEQNIALALLSGVALSFFAMTGFENAANVAEEVQDPQRSYPRALIGGMLTAGVAYVLVALAAAVTVPLTTLTSADVPLIEVVQSGALPVASSVLGTAFAVIAMTAIANTCLVALVTQSRILYGMAREGVVPRPFGRLHDRRNTPWVAIAFGALVMVALLLSGADVERLATVTVLFLLVVYGLVILAALRLGATDRPEGTFRAPRWLLVVGLVANALIFGYTIYDDWTSLIYCAALLAVGVLLWLLQRVISSRRSTTG